MFKKMRPFQIVIITVSIQLLAVGGASAQGNAGRKGGKPAGMPGRLGGVQAGLQGGGGAVNQGIGQTVSRLAKAGVHGQQLAALIHQMKGKGNPGRIAPGGNPAGPKNVGQKGARPAPAPVPARAPNVKPKPQQQKPVQPVLPKPAPGAIKPKPDGAANVGAKGGKPK